MISPTGLSPSKAKLSRIFDYHTQNLVTDHNTTSPNGRPPGFSLVYAPFTRRYSQGISGDFFSCTYLDVSVRCVPPPYGVVWLIGPYMEFLFGNRGIDVCLQLPRAYRS